MEGVTNEVYYYMKSTLFAVLAISMSHGVTALPAQEAKPATAEPKTEVAKASEAAKLTWGDPAPAWVTGAWVKGEPVKEFDREHAYLIECWASWCGPCIAAVPHVNELHEKFKDKGLVVIGQNVWESEPEKAKEAAAKMNYRVVSDTTTDQNGAFSKAWMLAAGLQGIPATFVVGKDGKIAWMGHPMQLDELIVKKILAGEWDTALEKSKATKGQEDDQQKRKTVQEIAARREAAITSKDWPAVEAAAAEIEKLIPSPDGFLQFDLAVAKQDDAMLKVMAAELKTKHDGAPMWKRHLAMAVLRREASPAGLAFAAEMATEGGAAAPADKRFLFSCLEAEILAAKGQKDDAKKMLEELVGKEAGEREKGYIQSVLKKVTEGK